MAVGRSLKFQHSQTISSKNAQIRQLINNVKDAKNHCIRTYLNRIPRIIIVILESHLVRTIDVLYVIKTYLHLKKGGKIIYYQSNVLRMPETIHKSNQLLQTQSNSDYYNYRRNTQNLSRMNVNTLS